MFSSRTDWPLVPNRLSQELEARRRRGLPVLDLTESNPTRCGFVFDAREILQALGDPRSLGYEPDPRGVLAARMAISEYYAERGVTVDPERIFLTTSTSEAYSYVFRLLADAGDNLLVPRPSYPLLDFLARLDGLELAPYSLVYDDGWRIDLQSLRTRAGPRTRAVLVVHPNNPTGSFVRRDEIDFLVEFCAARGLALISDEVFSDYALGSEDAAVQCARRAATHANVSKCLVCILNGLSKVSALPQMKLAWMILNGPMEILSSALARLELIADTYLSVSAPLAHALPKFLELRKRIQPQILNRVCSNLRWLDIRLLRGGPVCRLKIEGGWYVVLRLPLTRSDEEWAIELLREEGVLTHPGHFYDFPQEGHLVASLLPTPEIFQEGMTKLLARVAQSG